MTVDFADVKPSLMNAIVILLIVMVTVPAAKFVFNRFYVPGLTEMANAI